MAIPAFMKYVRRSKTAEATGNLRRIFDGAVAHYDAEHADRRGNILPAQFPPPVDWTPAEGCCGAAGDRCASPPAWQQPAWEALGFALGDPHDYQYRFSSGGEKEGAAFTAEARGDLDCDGTYSLFRRVGSVAGGEIVGTGVVVENEIE